jgi:hypothetical protein
MTRKKVSFGLKPGVAKDADDWVNEPSPAVKAKEERAPEAKTPKPPKMKRLTIDVPEQLHRTLKMKAAFEGKRMADLVRSWIEENCNV